VLRNRLQTARERLEQRARDRAKSEKAEYLRKVEAREKRKGRSKGPKVKPPNDKPSGSDQVNLVDADSRLMRKNKRSAYEQAYNSQATVDAEGSQLMLGVRVTQSASDANELAANVQSIPAKLGKPSAVVADSGYASEQPVKDVQAQQIQVYVSTGAESEQMRRTHDFRPPSRQTAKQTQSKADWLKAMSEKLQTDTGRALYARRKQTAEPVFGIIKHAMGFRQFLMRGLEKVSGEWQLVGLAYNCKRLWNLKLAMN
jgi:hypothetical protein